MSEMEKDDSASARTSDGEKDLYTRKTTDTTKARGRFILILATTGIDHWPCFPWKLFKRQHSTASLTSKIRRHVSQRIHDYAGPTVFHF